MFTVLAAVFPWIPEGIAVPFLAAFVAAELLRVRALPMMVGCAYLLVSVVLLALGTQGVWPSFLSLWTAIRKTLPLLVLFGAVLWLQKSLAQDRAFGGLGNVLARLRPGTRTLAMSLGGHFIGGLLNMAGLQLVLSLRGSSTEAGLARAMTLPTARGFSAAGCWSPFMIGMAAALTALSTRWGEVAAVGLFIGLSLVALTWLWSFASTTQSPLAAVSESDTPPLAPPLFVVLAAIVLVGTPVLLLHELASLAMPVAIGLTAPIVALLWYRVRTGRRSYALRSELYFEVPYLRNEMFVLLSANLFAVALLGHAPQILGWLEAQAGVALDAAATPAILVLVGTMLAAVGIHPIAFITFIGGTFPATPVEASRALVALALAVVWGLGTMVSPISAVNMIIARSLGESTFRIAWLYNGAFVAAAACLAAAILVLVSGFPGFSGEGT